MTGADGVRTTSHHDNVAVLLIDSPPVNALSHRVRVAIRDGLADALAENRVEAVVLACAGRTFFAGADMGELGRPIAPPLIGNLIAMIENASKPVVAALHGTALGGGFELALACHFRVAAPSAKMGLPEVALGLLPGAGGTQRLPRLIGVARAVELIGLGKTVAAPEGLAMGLIDALVEERRVVEDGVAFARSVIARNLPLRRVRDLPIDLSPDEARTVFDRFRADHRELFVGLKAAEGVLSAIEAAATLPFDEGMARERMISRELTASPESAAQRHLFFAERAAAKVPGADGLKPRAVATLRLLGDNREALAAAAHAAGLAVVDGDDADLVLAVDRPDGAAIAFRKSGCLIELVASSDADPLSLVDALAVARRIADAAVLAWEGSIVERLLAAAHASAERIGLSGVVIPGLVDGIGEENPVDDATALRFLDPIGAEALKLVDEGVAIRGSDIDHAMVRAGRWPVWLGGPAYWAARQDPAAYAERLRCAGLAVPASLRERIAEKQVVI